MTMAFSVGQKCVCINGKWWDMNGQISTGPEMRETCEIVGIEPGGLLGGQFLSLAGYGGDQFHSYGFRPIVDRKTDIGFAHEILRTATTPALIDSETLRAFDRAYAEAYPGYVPEYVRRARG
jgi:hypothetical protein